MSVATDVCICQHNLTGHCGIISYGGRINNDATLKVLAKIAASHAEAGADVVAPSAMMDGQVYAIKRSFIVAGLMHHYSPSLPSTLHPFTLLFGHSVHKNDYTTR